MKPLAQQIQLWLSWCWHRSHITNNLSTVNSDWKHDLTGEFKNMACQWSTYNKEEKMFVILTNRIDQKQTSVAENKLFSLEKYVPRNNSPNLPEARNIRSPSSTVWTGGNYASRLLPWKNEKHILVIWLIEQHKDNDNDLKMWVCCRIPNS